MDKKGISKGKMLTVFGIDVSSAMVRRLLIAAVLLIMALFVGIDFFRQYRQFAEGYIVHTDLSQDEQKQWANVVLMPTLADQIERYGTMRVNDFTRVSIETCRYRTLEDMCNALPNGCSDPIRTVIASGDGDYSYDIGKESAKYYTIEQGLPLISEQELGSDDLQLRSRIYKIYYQVFEYFDGSYRFFIWFEYQGNLQKQ